MPLQRKPILLHQKILALIFVGVVCFLAGAIVYESSKMNSPERVAEREAVSQERETQRSNDFENSLNGMRFVHDNTTDLCFAYLWMGMGNGGPSLANVPCEGLLIDVEFNSGK